MEPTPLHMVRHVYSAKHLSQMTKEKDIYKQEIIID